MPTSHYRPRQSIRPATSRYLPALGIVLALLGAFSFLIRPAAEAAPAVGPDLTVEILVNPTVPEVGQEVEITFVVHNKGTSSTGSGFTVHLYIDPADRPPTADTMGRPFGFPALPANGTAQASRTHTFTTQGCNHVVYVWVDRENDIVESDETNNLVALEVCVGVQCELDDFEEDDTAENAGWIAAGATQQRSFCRDAGSGPDPAGDEDWLKFTAFAGLTYTLATANTGSHADPRLTLWSSGANQALAGPADAVVWQPPANGVYYVQIANAGDKDGTGPLTRYDLRLTAQAAVTDEFEPDDACGMARTIATDNTRQSRLFQAPGDVDWVKFTIGAGETFALVIDQTGPGVSPLVSLFASCSDARSAAAVATGSNRVEGRSTGDQVYFARIANQNPDRFGAGAGYRLGVLASSCVPDAFEENDTLNGSKPLALNETQTHNVCPAGDQDWARLELSAGEIYVIKTGNLGFAADTVLELRDSTGALLASNDDYDYVKASRLVFEPATTGTYYAVVYHHNVEAAGASTNYDLSLETGFCVPDEADGDDGDNGSGDARLLTTGDRLARNFCADPLSGDLGDQDWLRFSAVAGARYHIRTEDLGPNADTVLRLYDRDGFTLLRSSDDAGAGLATELVFTPTVAGDYFVQVTQYNSRLIGPETSYHVRLEENLPPTPTPTPSPTPSPTPTPPPPPDPSEVRTLILTNRAQLEALHGAGPAGLVMAKLFELAAHSDVAGAVVQVEDNPSVAAAYAAWTADNTTLSDNDLANEVAEAIRNQILAFSATAPDLAYIVIAGDDRVIPFRRVAEAPLAKNENEYAAELAGANTVAAALAEDKILTDDFYADEEPSQWKGNELFIPDFAVGRLIQEPVEIIGQIDLFLAEGGNLIDTQRALVTGYDFVQDSATLMRSLMVNDVIPSISPPDFIGPFWPGDALRSVMLSAPPATNRFDLISINGHATHLAIGVPDQNDIEAGEILSATNDFTRSLIYNLGCHGGLNDSDTLDLPQAFVSRGAVYVGNTGFGWGGGGIAYSEALMRNFTRELLTNTQTEVGPALTAAKQTYVSRARVFGGYDAKILMQTTLYGLPMMGITSGGTLNNDVPFPSLEPSITPPGSFSDQPNVGSFGYGLPNSFGAFGADEENPDYKLNLDGNAVFEAGAPIQPGYFRDLSAPAAGALRGVIFRGGVYSDTITEAPIALAYNEYITDTTPPPFSADGWYPPVPFDVQSSAYDPALRDTIVLALGQYDPGTGAQRVFDHMSFDTYYSDSADRTLAEIGHIDAVLDPAAGKGNFKVEAVDASGISRVVIAYTEGAGVWSSADLAYDTPTAKWTGSITATATTRYFVQVVDGAGNIAIDDNKGRYYPLLPLLPLVEGSALQQRFYLPHIQKGD